MENRYQIALSAGLLSAAWVATADVFGLIAWVGFLGCSTFFAQTRSGFKGLLLTWATNLSGVFWAWVVIAGSGFFDSQIIGYLLTGITGAMMCLQASNHRLAFIPGAFIGSCTTFAMGGEVAALLPSLLIGGALGFAMAMFTQPLIQLSNKLSESFSGANNSQNKSTKRSSVKA